MGPPRPPLLLVLLLSACGGAATASPTTLDYYFASDPRSLDPALSTDVPTGEVAALLFDNLTRFDVDGGLVPGLARSWDTDRAGTTYTFHLRKGPVFHDGRTISARDVRASFLRALAPRIHRGPWLAALSHPRRPGLLREPGRLGRGHPRAGRHARSC